MTDLGPPFRARYPGRCPLCGDQFDPGTLIARHDRGYVHAEPCAATSPDATVIAFRRPPTPVIDRWLLAHLGDGHPHRLGPVILDAARAGHRPKATTRALARLRRRGRIYHFRGSLWSVEPAEAVSP